jgi:hypothetical protein
MYGPHQFVSPSVIRRDPAVLSKSAPVLLASHNSGERLLRSDTADAGAGTKVFVVFGACCIIVLLALLLFF